MEVQRDAELRPEFGDGGIQRAVSEVQGDRLAAGERRGVGGVLNFRRESGGAVLHFGARIFREGFPQRRQGRGAEFEQGLRRRLALIKRPRGELGDQAVGLRMDHRRFGG